MPTVGFLDFEKSTQGYIPSRIKTRANINAAVYLHAKGDTM